MFRLLHALAVAALILLAGLSLDARFAGVWADDVADCEEGSGDTAIRGCSQIIKSGRLLGEPISKEDLAIVYNNRGFAYHDKGDYDRAIADHDAAIKLNLKYADAYNYRGFAFYEKGDYDRAIADYDTAIKLNPKYADAYNYRGFAFYDEKGDYDRAIADYDTAIKLNPKGDIAYRLRGEAYHDKGDYDRAIADYTQAIKLDPKDDIAYNNRGLAYDEKGDYDRAIADYDTAIKLDPKDAAVYNNRGSTYDEKGQYDRAIADYDTAIKLDPKDAVAYNNRGSTYYNKGDYDRAIADYDTAIKLDPNLTKAHDNRRLAFEQLGQRDKAVADTQKAKALDLKLAELERERKLLIQQEQAALELAREARAKAHDTMSRAEGFGAYLGGFIGTIAAHLTDPVMWIFIILAVGLGWAMVAWYWLIIVSALSAGVNVFLVYEWWTKLFSPDEIVPKSLRLVPIHLIIIFAAYGIAYGLTYLRSGKRGEEGQPEARTNEKDTDDQETEAIKSLASQSQDNLEADLKAQGVACVKELEGKWSVMNEQFHFKQDVSLEERMFMFAIPAFEKAQKKYPLLLAHPEESGSLLVTMIGNAVINSGSHPKHEVNEALPLLNDRLRQHFQS